MVSLNGRIDVVQREMMDLQAQTQKDKPTAKKLLGVRPMSMDIIATPTEQIWQVLMQPHLSAAIRRSMDISLFDVLNMSDLCMTTNEIAKKQVRISY